MVGCLHRSSLNSGWLLPCWQIESTWSWHNTSITLHIDQPFTLGKYTPHWCSVWDVLVSKERPIPIDPQRSEDGYHLAGVHGPVGLRNHLLGLRCLKFRVYNLEWNVSFCLMRYLFGPNGKVKLAFLGSGNRDLLVEGCVSRWMSANRLIHRLGTSQIETAFCSNGIY